jgi:predicted nucleic acid-binding Zn ribbon protein
MGPTAGILDGLLDAMESGARIRESMALAFWPRAVGPHVASASHAEEVRDGVLIVRTKGSTWSHEISLLKYRILPELNRLCGRQVVRDIRFLAGGLPERGTVTEDARPTEEDLRAVRFSQSETDAMRASREAVAAIPDRATRATILRVMDRRHRLLRWRLDHGWRPCAGCGSVHDGPGAFCTVCEAGS